MAVKFGIIGLGGIAHRFVKVLKSSPNAELIAVASTNGERSASFAKEYDVPTSYEGYEALVKDEQIEAIYIAQTHDLHKDLIKLCIDNKKAVLCEKPMVLTKADAIEVTEYAKEKNVLLMEAMWSRFIPTFIQAKKWIEEGKIGKVRLVTASFCFNFPLNIENRLYDPNRAGGSLYDAGVYPIEFTTGILEENPTETVAVGSICETGVDDFVAMSMKFESGALASLSCGFRSNTNQDGIIYGDEGKVVVYGLLGFIDQKVELYNKEDKLMDEMQVTYKDGFIYEIEHFIELFNSGKIESPVIPFEDNIATSEIFENVLDQITK